MRDILLQAEPGGRYGSGEKRDESDGKRDV